MTAFWRTKTEGPQENTELREVQFTINDMTLRDYFAAKAMGLNKPIVYGTDETSTEDSFRWAAAYCYQYADAMLVERTK